MSYRATVLNVMLASPSDVSKERRIVRDVVHEWNAVNSADREIVLMPIGWETNAFPEMGDRPQALINRQLLDGCDVLIAVFWTRLGSPTGTAASGTVEEIQEHLAANKPALIYFSVTPVRLDSVDSAQYEALLEFKSSLLSKGLVQEYEDLAGFREKVARHLAQTVIRMVANESVAPDGLGSPTPPTPKLSDSAQELLVEASSDKGGAIMRLNTLGGSHVQTNGREFIGERDARLEARWRGAVDELEREGLIEDRVGKGEVFFVTDYGYVVADVLSKT